MKQLTLTTLFCFLSAVVASAGVREAAPDKASGAVDYPMSTDRPDITESPFSVKKGFWQFEMETVSVSLDGREQWEDWGSVNIKYGLSHHTDIQLVTPAWHTGDDGDGWSDVEVRFKWNLTGQERLDGAAADRAFAIALMPYVKLPTASRGLGNGEVEGGIIVPFSFTNMPLTYMVQVDAIRNEEDDGYTGALTLSATYAREFGDRVSGFTEVVATMPMEGAAEVYLNAGLVYEMNENWFLDLGVNAGLNDEATDLRFFTGMSWRF